MAAVIRRDRPRAVWWEIVTYLDGHHRALKQQGRHDEAQAVINARYKVQTMLDNDRWNGVLKLHPDTTRVLDDAFAALCGVVEEPGGTVSAAMIADAADAYIRSYQRGRPRRNYA